jgi:hypothetical protein
MGNSLAHPVSAHFTTATEALVGRRAKTLSEVLEFAAQNL